MNRLFSGVLTGLLFAAADARAAELVFAAPVASAPCGAWQKQMEVEIPFEVKGPGVFEVRDVRTGCDCTKAETDAPRYVSPAKGVLKVRFEPGRRVGFQRKTLLVRSKSGEESAVFFQTTVPEPLVVLPGVLLWNKTDLTQSKVINVSLGSAAERISALTATSASPALTCKVAPTVKPAGFQVTVTWVGSPPATPVKISLRSNHPEDDGSRYIVWASVK